MRDPLKKKRHRAEVKTRSAAILEARLLLSINVLYGDGFLFGACGGHRTEDIR